ncbi:MAG: hypothetical protein V3W31_07195 [Thermodesulfobacteriota bacterium]
MREPDHGLWYAFGALFFLSASILIIEISFTQIFSATLQNPMIFGVVGSTILGLGLGGFLYYRLSTKRPALVEGEAFFIVSGLVFALSILLLLYLVTRFPWQWQELIPMVIASFIPGGLLMASIYARFALKGHLLYYGDLGGASIGCLLAIVLLNGLGGPINTVIAAAGIIVLIPLVFAFKSGSIRAVTAVAALLAGVIALGTANQGRGVIRVDYSKVGIDSFQKTSLAEERILETRWDAYSRVDLVRDTEDTRLIFINGGTLAPMLRIEGREKEGVEELLRVIGPLNSVPFFFLPKDEVLIIGSGGGMQVATALLAGSGHVTAVEVNPLVVETVLDHSDYNGGIYRYRNVDVAVDEGRSFLKRSSKNYDLIFLPLAYSLISVKSGRLIFTEDYLHTLDAFGDYWDHLPRGGRLAIIINEEMLLTRLISTALSLLEERGLSPAEALSSLVVLNTAEGTPYSNLIMIKKGGFFREEAGELMRFAENSGLNPLHIPYEKPRQPELARLAEGSISLREWVGSAPFNINPATDKSPFFFNLRKGVPKGLTMFFWTTLAVMLVFTALFIGRYDDSGERDNKGGSLLVQFLLYFMAIGMGYMLIEISLAQRFILFLGYPTLSLSVVLFSFLLSGGFGSLLSPYLFKGSPAARSSAAAIGVVSLLLVYYAGLPAVFEAALSSSIGIKSLVTFVLILPLGFFMGVPFPAGLVMLKGRHPGAVPWMWGVNAISSFAGALLVIMVAMKWGFHLSLPIAALLYGAVAVLSARMGSGPRPSGIQEGGPSGVRERGEGGA